MFSIKHSRHIDKCTSVYIHPSLSTHNVCASVSVCVCVYVCVCVCVCVHVHAHKYLTCTSMTCDLNNGFQLSCYVI